MCNKQKCPNAFNAVVGVARKRNVQATANILSKEMLTGKGTEAEPKIPSCTNISYPHYCIALRGLQPSNCGLNQTSSQPLPDLSIDNTGYFKLDHSPPKYIYLETKVSSEKTPAHRKSNVSPLHVCLVKVDL